MAGALIRIGIDAGSDAPVRAAPNDPEANLKMRQRHAAEAILPVSILPVSILPAGFARPPMPAMIHGCTV